MNMKYALRSEDTEQINVISWAKLLPVRELCLQSVYLSLSSLFQIMPLTFYSTIFLYRVQVATDGSYK